MKTALLWNTYEGDIEWFRYSASSFSKFARGRFHFVACLVPSRHRDSFRAPCEQHGITLLDHPDWHDKSFNWHQMWQCQADLLFPEADAIWHMDADTVFAAPSGPEDWMRDGKIICPFVTFDHLLQAAGREGNWQWKSRVDDAIGGDVKLATMTGHPHAHYRNVYARVREEVARKNPMGFERYVQRQQNSFPQGFCEFETLGAIAQNFYHNDYHWLDIQKELHPSTGRVAASYSHGGLDAAHEYGPAFGGRQTPRQLFQRLGL
jgi:hypothetical protein